MRGVGGGRAGLCCQTVSASNQIVLHCCVKFQMTSKDVFFFPSVRRRRGVILIEAQSRYSQAGPVTGLVKGTTTGCAKKIFPAHSSCLLKSVLLPPLMDGVTASVFIIQPLLRGRLLGSAGFFETTPDLSQNQNHNTFFEKSFEKESFSIQPLRLQPPSLLKE